MEWTWKTMEMLTLAAKISQFPKSLYWKEINQASPVLAIWKTNYSTEPALSCSNQDLDSINWNSLGPWNEYSISRAFKSNGATMWLSENITTYGKQVCFKQTEKEKKLTLKNFHVISFGHTLTRNSFFSPFSPPPPFLSELFLGHFFDWTKFC